jgi:hypothetical protein
MSSYNWFYGLHNLRYIDVTLCIYTYERINENALDTILSRQTLLSRIVLTILLETRYQHDAHRFFFREEESTVHRGRMLPPSMPLAYLILQAIIQKFYRALLCGYDLSHPPIQSDLLRMISYLVGDQRDDAHMAEQEEIPEAAAPPTQGPTSPMSAPAPCPMHGYAPCPPHEACPMNPDFDAAARTPTPPSPPRTPPTTLVARMSASSHLMAYVAVDPTPAAPPPSPASPERVDDIAAPPPCIIRTWIHVPHGPSAHRLANGDSTGFLPSTKGAHAPLA